MQTLYALDLTELPGADDLWRRRTAPKNRLADDRLSLPADGFASPLGFWFAAAGSWGSVVTSLRVEIRDLGEQNGWHHSGVGLPPGVALACRSYRARLKLKVNKARSAGSTTTLLIEIDPSTARIEVTPGFWESVSEPVLIVVAQFWRFLAIERVLDELARWARADLLKSGFINLIHRRRSRELNTRRRVLQALVLDLPDFEIFLTNPGEGLAPGRPIRIYRALARQLGHDRQRRALDERVEVIEAVFDSLAESCNHFQALVFQLVLELAIVALLLLDIALYFLDGLAR